MNNDGHRKVYIPQMSEHAFALAGVMRGMNIDAEVLPKPDDTSMELGLAVCRGRECLPCLLCTGDLLRKCKEPDFDADTSVFLMPQTIGSCRFGQYNVLQKQILAEEGFADVQLLSPRNTDSYALSGDDALTLRKRAWHAVVAVDLLLKVRNETRPYEIQAGSADALYHDCLQRIVEACEAGCHEHLIQVVGEVAQQFAAFPVDRSEIRPLIGVIGEFYLLQNERANLNIVRAVEQAGGEALMGTCMEYLHYVDWKRKAVARLFGAYGDFFKASLSDQYQKKWERRFLKPMKPVLRHPIGSPTSEIMHKLRRHYEPLLGTEGVLTMGSAFDVYKHGAAGVINVLPFSCMPGTIAASMAPVLRQDMEGIPWLDIAYDGQEETNTHTRLGAFMHQSLQFHRRVVLKRTSVGVPDVPPISSNGTDHRSVTVEPPELVPRKALRVARGSNEDLTSPVGQPFRLRIGRGVGIFAALTVAGLGVLVALTGGREAVMAARNLSLGFVALAALASLVDLLIGALRYSIFFRRIKPDVSFWLIVRAHLAHRFASTITPSQTGGGPAMLYVYSRAGIPVSQGLSVLVVNFIPTLLFFVVSSAIASYILRDSFSGQAINYFIRYGFVAFGSMALLVLIVVLRPTWLRRTLLRLARLLRRKKGRVAHRIAQTLGALVAGIGQYHSTCLHFLRKTPGLLVLSSGLMLVMYLAKFTMAYFVALGLGVRPDYVLTLAVQVLLHFIVFLAPSPGGSGIAELTTGALMVLLMPAALLGVFTVAYRFFLVYLPASIGAFVLITALNRPQSVAGAQAKASSAQNLRIRRNGTPPELTKRYVGNGTSKTNGALHPRKRTAILETT